jgi:transposase
MSLEACGGAHHWARKLERLGHTVKLMAPQFVKPYVKMVWPPPFVADPGQLR